MRIGCWATLGQYQDVIGVDGHFHPGVVELAIGCSARDSTRPSSTLEVGQMLSRMRLSARNFIVAPPSEILPSYASKLAVIGVPHVPHHRFESLRAVAC